MNGNGSTREHHIRLREWAFNSASIQSHTSAWIYLLQSTLLILLDHIWCHRTISTLKGSDDQKHESAFPGERSIPTYHTKELKELPSSKGINKLQFPDENHAQKKSTLVKRYYEPHSK